MGTYLLPRCPSLWVFVGDRNRSYEMLFFMCLSTGQGYSASSSSCCSYFGGRWGGPGDPWRTVTKGHRQVAKRQS